MKKHDLVILPLIIILFTFGVLPTLGSVFLSLYKWYLPDPRGPFFIGFQNYMKVLADPYLINALKNSSLFAFTASAIEISLGLGLSIYLYRKIAFDSKLYRIIVLASCIPLTVSPMVTGILLVIVKANVYRFLSGHGLLFNLYSRELALPLLMIVDAWQWTPLFFLIFMAKLHSLPGEFIEAAQIDGASDWLMLRKIALPFLKPMILIIVLLRGVDAFKVLDIIFTTQGGPVSETETINFYIFKTFFTFSEIGYGAALSTFLTFAIQIPIIALILYYVEVKKVLLF